MAKAPRRFDESYKREAVRLLEEIGRPLRGVAEELKGSQQVRLPPRSPGVLRQSVPVSYACIRQHDGGVHRGVDGSGA